MSVYNFKIIYLFDVRMIFKKEFSDKCPKCLPLPLNCFYCFPDEFLKFGNCACLVIFIDQSVLCFVNILYNVLCMCVVISLISLNHSSAG